MKKFIIIIILAVIQCACASSPGSLPASPSASTSMLSFDAIGAEITVDYQNLEAQDEPPVAVAMNRD